MPSSDSMSSSKPRKSEAKQDRTALAKSASGVMPIHVVIAAPSKVPIYAGGMLMVTAIFCLLSSAMGSDIFFRLPLTPDNSWNNALANRIILNLAFSTISGSLMLFSGGLVIFRRNWDAAYCFALGAEATIAIASTPRTYDYFLNNGASFFCFVAEICGAISLALLATCRRDFLHPNGDNGKKYAGSALGFGRPVIPAGRDGAMVQRYLDLESTREAAGTIMFVAAFVIFSIITGNLYSFSGMVPGLQDKIHPVYGIYNGLLMLGSGAAISSGILSTGFKRGLPAIVTAIVSVIAMVLTFIPNPSFPDWCSHLYYGDEYVGVAGIIAPVLLSIGTVATFLSRKVDLPPTPA